MNRSRFIPRTGSAGSPAALAAAQALGMVADAELIDAFRRHVQAVDEFGGEIYVGGDRRKVREGRVVDNGDPEGSFMTLGYIVGYNHKTRFPQAALEDDVPYELAGAPELESVPESEPEDVAPEAEDVAEAEAEEAEREEAAA